MICFLPLDWHSYVKILNKIAQKTRQKPTSPIRAAVLERIQMRTNGRRISYDRTNTQNDILVSRRVLANTAKPVMRMGPST